MKFGSPPRNRLLRTAPDLILLCHLPYKGLGQCFLSIQGPMNYVRISYIGLMVMYLFGSQFLLRNVFSFLICRPSFHAYPISIPPLCIPSTSPSPTVSYFALPYTRTSFFHRFQVKGIEIRTRPCSPQHAIYGQDRFHHVAFHCVSGILYFQNYRS